jgi:DNA uptake protein ComE-like DNA-binding protein
MVSVEYGMAEREPDPVQIGRDAALRTAQSVAFLVAVGVCLVLSLRFAAGMLQRSPSPTTARWDERINPNEAPVASLMRLPQVGVARARAIVAHRQRAGAPAGRPPAFKTADDLQQIKGIGPAIVEDLRPWLQFDDPANDANGPAPR